jgi:NAD(P)-dependent dehydrogenase (short-subunit alcohol dehydrogenase family)
MADEGFKRKLTAILSADVVGHIRLMGDNEEETIRTLTNYREVIGNLIRQHSGRVVDTTGDNLLSEFSSAVDAVNCAVAIQREPAGRNAELSDGRRMEFRIGVNVGDVVEEKSQIYGDGVNIAARVEGLAEAGGICISGSVYDHVENKLDLKYEIPQMLAQGSGSIVNTTSTTGLFIGGRYRGAYSASKAGIVSLSKVAALECAEYGLRVNVICPTARTPMLERFFERNPEAETDFTAQIPMGRIFTPEEIAEGALWLLSDASSFVTGHVLAAEGGYLIR